MPIFEENNIFNIALPVAVDNIFAYEIINYNPKEEYIGRRVLVQFTNRLLTGVIIEKNTQESFEYKVKPIIELLDNEPVFSLSMVKFFRWMSRYYIAPIGDVIRAVLPPAVSPKSVRKIDLLRMPDKLELKQLKMKSPRRAEILKVLSKMKNEISIAHLQKKVDFSISMEQLDFLKNRGYIELTENIQETKAKLFKAVKISDKYFDEDKLSSFIAGIEDKAPKQVAILEYLWDSKNQAIFIKDLTKAVKQNSNSAIKTLIKKEVLSEFELQEDRAKISTEESLADRNEIKLKLSDEQENCYQELNRALLSDKYETFLLKGVTGSGKTLVYMHLIKDVIEKGGGAIFLLPEISLTPQLIDRFEKVFPGKIAQLHSRLLDGERSDNWKSIASGEKRIVIGARSAIFAPVQNLKTIIVDEEHESSYKQYSPTPRYNARDAAIVRASLEGILCVLGSATPSIESMYNASTNKYKLLEINNRADNATLPDVKIIDMLNATKSEQVVGSYSKDLLDKIVEKIRKKEGVILFLNRRGYSPILECTNCGHIPECKHCSVTLTYHKHKNQLRCHYCGYTEYAQKICPKCNTGEMKVKGVGTQRAEEELNDYLKEIGINAVIERIDLDTTARKGAFRKILNNFSTGRTDILLGTQMIAKGLDFGRCTLVGVINADTQLFISDFRSSERTFQLLTQVSGRAGRSAENRGEVIIQSSHPENPAINYALKADYESYYNFEVETRKESHYPPFVRFCIIEFSGEDEGKLMESANYFYKSIEREKSLMIYDPVKPILEKIKGSSRVMLIIKSFKELDKSGNLLRNVVKSTLEYHKKYFKSNIKIKIDIDSFGGL
jgi:primosomal protein N' (replication factor Y)